MPTGSDNKRTRAEMETQDRVYTDVDLRFKRCSNTPHEFQFQQWTALRNVFGFYGINIDWYPIDEALEELTETPDKKLSDVLTDRQYRDIMEEIIVSLKEFLTADVWEQTLRDESLANQTDALQKQAAFFRELDKIGLFKYL